ncbi:MAG: TolC family protein [Desulfotomaculales bacterium]
MARTTEAPCFWSIQVGREGCARCHRRSVVPDCVRRKARLERGRENHRLASLRYGVGVGTSLEVLQASEQLLRLESRYVEALFNYHLALLTFETAKVAPVSGLTGGATSSASGSSTSTR